MRKSAKIITALSVAGLAVAAGSAFTAGNTLPGESIKGYGQTKSSGVIIDSMTFNTVSGDTSRLATVTFTSTTDTRLEDVTMTLKNGTEVVGTTGTCSTVFELSVATITCDAVGDPLLNSFDTTGLTVL